MGYDFAMTFSIRRTSKTTPPETGAGTAFRQTGKITHRDGIRDVAYRNEQGNCIDSFHRNLRNAQISL